MCKLFIIFLLFLFSPVLSDLGEWTSNKNEVSLSSNSNKKRVVRYCQPQTPCGWMIYPYLNYPGYWLINDYCSCKPGYSCALYQNREEAGFSEYRCQPSIKQKT